MQVPAIRYRVRSLHLAPHVLIGLPALCRRAGFRSIVFDVGNAFPWETERGCCPFGYDDRTFKALLEKCGEESVELVPVVPYTSGHRGSRRAGLTIDSSCLRNADRDAELSGAPLAALTSRFIDDAVQLFPDLGSVVLVGSSPESETAAGLIAEVLSGAGIDGYTVEGTAGNPLSLVAFGSAADALPVPLEDPLHGEKGGVTPVCRLPALTWIARVGGGDIAGELWNGVLGERAAVLPSVLETASRLTGELDSFWTAAGRLKGMLSLFCVDPVAAGDSAADIEHTVGELQTRAERAQDIAGLLRAEAAAWIIEADLDAACRSAVSSLRSELLSLRAWADLCGVC